MVDNVRIDIPADSTIYDGGIAPVNFCTYFTPDNGAAIILNRFASDRYKLVAFLATDGHGSDPTAVTEAVIPSADQQQVVTDGQQVCSQCGPNPCASFMKVRKLVLPKV